MKVLVTGGSGFIGTNFIGVLVQKNIKVMNIDIQRPFDSNQDIYWEECDILDREKLYVLFEKFQPTHVIHLAARTDCDETVTVEEGYQTNTIGTSNVLGAIKKTSSIKRVIITSSQFVFKTTKDLPKNFTDYRPHTVYGQSKVITEQLTIDSNIDCSWTIIRPTTIWGPWDMNYRRQFYTVLQKGFYAHPGKKLCYRSYGYVGNVVHQIYGLFEAPSEKVDKQVFYVGDPMINVLTWVNAFFMAMHGKKVRVVPCFLFAIMAKIGDLIGIATRKRFYIDTARFNSMIEPYPVDLAPTFSLLGESYYSLEESVRKNLMWQKQNW